MTIPFTHAPHYPPIAPGRFAAGLETNPDRAPHCRVALIGLADDTGVVMNSGRPGARNGPTAFRAALARYGVADPMPDQHDYRETMLPPNLVFDAGDIIPGDSITQTHDRVTEVVSVLLEMGLLPIGIGGGHDLTYPFVRASAARKTVESGLYVDAHLDVRPQLGSGMPFRRLMEEFNLRPVVNIGAEPMVNSNDHFEWFTRRGGVVCRPEQTPPDRALQLLSPRGCFVSIDVDSIDASQAPGVSAINPCGLSVAQVAAYAQAAGSDPRVQCFDIMEFNPAHDIDGRTARVAAYLFLRFLSGLARRPTS